MTLKPYMILRNGIWYFRKRYPTDLAELIGRKECLKSLNTGDKKLAVIKEAEEEAKFYSSVEYLKNKAKDYLPLRERIRGYFVEYGLIETAFPLHAINSKFIKEKQASLEKHVNNKALEERKPILGISEVSDAQVLSTAQAILLKMRLSFKELDKLEDILSGKYSTEDFEKFDKKLSEIDRNIYKSGSLREQAPPQKRESDIKLSAAFKKWQEVAKPSETSLKEWNVAFGRFVSLHGDMYLHDLKKRHISEYTECLQGLAARLPNEYSKLPLRDLVKISNSKYKDKPKLEPSTINKQITAISTIIETGVKYFDVGNNPARNMQLKENSGGYRKSYEQEELDKMLKNIWFRVPPDERDAKFWLPLVGMHTGARLSEICQLTKKDIKEESGINYFEITNYDGKKAKTKNSVRKIPIHNNLIKIGILDYINNCKSEYPFIKPNFTPLGYSKKFSSYWSMALKKMGIKGNDKRQPFHSFRHTAKDRFRNNRIDTPVGEAIMGHASGRVSESYGDGYDMVTLNNELQKVNFDKVDFKHLYPENWKQPKLVIRRTK